MKKLKSKSGLTLMEMMAALLVMVLLVVGMGTGMDSGMRVYRESKFETDSAALADILNTSMSDLLRYAQDIKSTTATPDGIDFTFTNPEFGVLDGYFQMSDQDNSSGSVQLKNMKDTKPLDLVNAGAYPDLYVCNLHITYVPAGGIKVTTRDENGQTKEEVPVNRGGFFYITYNIRSEIDSEKDRFMETVVRQMNAQ